MPHVVVQGKVTPEEVARSYEPIMHRDGSTILKTDKAYLATTGDALVVEALAIETGEKRSFLAMVQKRDDGVVVRLHPLLDPEKTVGVKTILALLGAQIRGHHDGCTYGETNLQDLLPD